MVIWATAAVGVVMVAVIDDPPCMMQDLVMNPPLLAQSVGDAVNAYVSRCSCCFPDAMQTGLQAGLKFKGLDSPTP